MLLSRQSIEAALLVSFAVLAVGFAGFFEAGNETIGDGSHSDTVAPSIPFPHPSWLDRVATSETTFTAPDGIQYSSAYDAVLYGDALGNPCRNFNAYINSIFFRPNIAGKVVTKFGVEWGHYVLCYFRNFMGAMIVYYLTAGIFHYFCYVHPMSNKIFADRVRPSSEIMWNQIKLSQASMTIYTLLPVIDEFVIEQGYTKVYHTISEIGGWPYHILTMLVYFACVEVGIYWMHRTLHTNKTLYKYIHLKHHQYNTPETLTPWASIAFHPLDGMLQASPYVFTLPFVPCHYLTHFGLLFFTAIWATYIHDAMDWNVYPVMGSKYHTVHHTHYIYNYGQVFVFCDKIWGTYRLPDGPTGKTGKRQKKVV